MKFRSITGDDVVIHHMNKSGPTGNSCIVGKEWRELPEMFHELVVLKGCESSKMYEEAEGRIQKEIEIRVNQAKETVQTQKQSVIEKIGDLIEKNNVGAFLKNGKPKSPVLSQLCDFQVTNAMRDECWFLYNEGKSE